jgi:hypothetical protein
MVSMGVQPEKEGPTEGLRHVAMNKPVTIDVRAEKVLALLAGKLEAGEIVLGGYFALQHYADYRRTHDIDAWWKTRASPAAERVMARE